ncbi:MAG TPA: hypothetical protein VIN58_06510 [Roseateles sp.]
MKAIQIRALLALMIALVVQVANAGDSCFSKEDSNNYATLLGDRTSWGIATKQAKHTWDDWIWRGPEFYCNRKGGKCQYSWVHSNTKGYTWSVGVDMKLDKLPIIGSTLNMFNIEGSYQRTNSYTESFGWSQDIFPGQHAQPVQVVVRRWKSGYFQGGWWRVNGGGCWVSKGFRGAGAVAGNRYWWDGKARYGSWSASVEEKRFGMYHIW